MTDKSLKLAAGSLLHDFGKLLYRYNDGRNHSISGYDYLKERSLFKDSEEILECIKYHHGALLAKSGVKNDAICYITYIADNIAAATDRRANDLSDGGFVRDIPSETVFNILNGNNEKMEYSPDVLSAQSGINYPTEECRKFDEKFYGEIVDSITDSLKGITLTDEYINSLLQLLESYLTYIPSSTQIGELRDISLYDHVKMTAAFALCIEKYLDENKITDYKQALFDNSKAFYDKKAFCIYSIDISGIQQFIYNISSKGALKALRSRSFYLEILMENAVDELLSRLGLCRANVLYTGGGHTYLLIPASDSVVNTVEKFDKELNDWLMRTYGNALYAAGGYAFCSANDLKNVPEGSYKKIFRTVSESISSKKLRRYGAADIIALNAAKAMDNTRECSVCHRSDMLASDNKCIVCSGLEKLANDIIGNSSFFAVMKSNISEKSVPLPFGCVLTSFTESEMREAVKKPEYVRAYSKNKGYTGVNIVSNLWVGDYAAEKEFAKLADNSGGINRIAVIRADVDNMGQAFVSGFEKTGEGKYETISRTAALSRKLSLYFKLHINQILENGEFQLNKSKSAGKRNAVIVYSGGDDLFIAGGWDDIICFAVDMYRSFAKFSQETLTFSAGIGIFPPKYPISAIAEKTGELEDLSKDYKDKSKNAVTLFDESGTYSWNELIDNVIGEKLRTLQEFLDDNSERGKAMLYKMLELIRDKSENDKLNIARFAYLLARLRPSGDNAAADMSEKYNIFSKALYKWIQDAEERRRLITAIYIYIYMHRESEEKQDGLQ